MKPLLVLLEILASEGNQCTAFRFLQTLAYFVDASLELGFRFGPDYFGMYSPRLETIIGKAEALGFIGESPMSAHNRESESESGGACYALLPDGEEALRLLRKRLPECSRAVREKIELIRSAASEDKLTIAGIVGTLFSEQRTLPSPEVLAGAQGIIASPKDITDGLKLWRELCEQLRVQKAEACVG